MGQGGTVTALEPEQFYDEEVWNALKERHPDIKLESYRFEKLHRIDPADARKDFEEAGFVFEAESDMLANADDPRDISVFDPAIRGKTDRFVYRFRKPAS
ncbi:hypothetical protein P7228_10630 [Altererythrobacter arenosus]|uniref:Methyltransferase n=1 Tax=Altererythrobacter arenosus TaxID=3032592 RepID=A0ABY8FN52_9SPHN|nr:hypothetical protein [Altererythrobacter sp. CAU 1644]WFL76452.1 hypothetical protein P7228_10630 [Altererythrobacter sp. CAU 1644]